MIISSSLTGITLFNPLLVASIVRFCLKNKEWSHKDVIKMVFQDDFCSEKRMFRKQMNKREGMINMWVHVKRDKKS